MPTTSHSAAGQQKNPILQIKNVGERAREIYSPHCMEGTNTHSSENPCIPFPKWLMSMASVYTLYSCWNNSIVNMSWLTDSCCTCMSSVISEFSFVSASSSTSQLCWLGSSADPLRELPALLDGGSGMPLGVVCGDLPSSRSGVKSSTNLEGDLLLTWQRKCMYGWIPWNASKNHPPKQFRCRKIIP